MTRYDAKQAASTLLTTLSLHHEDKRALAYIIAYLQFAHKAGAAEMRERAEIVVLKSSGTSNAVRAQIHDAIHALPPAEVTDGTV